jgi:type IV pilus assembly protein PilY1
MKALRIRSLAVLLCLFVVPLTAGATDVRFEQGSLIIPEQMAYQSRCGTVASYGLVYRLLQQKVTVYWAVQPTKTSHHRCKNTSDDKRYIDGCDFAVEKETGRPVSLLKNSAGTFSDDFMTFSTLGNPNSTGEADMKVDNKRTRLRYMGGPFIVDATEAARAVELIRSHPDFSLFRGNEPTVPSTCNPGAYFNVRVHRANNAFVAPIARIMNEVPPPIALVRGRNTTNAGSVEILVAYLNNAGLNFAGAQGIFSEDETKRGKIFDVLDQDADLTSSSVYPYGKLNAPDPKAPGKTYYKVMWSPHWEGDTSSTSQKNNLKSALSNISRFVDSGNSIFNECASIATYENTYLPTDSNRLIYPDWLNKPTQFMTGADATNPGKAQAKTGLQTLYIGELTTVTNNNSIIPFAQTGQDCSDPGRVGDCYSFSNYGDLFSQKGDYEFAVAATSAVEAFRWRKDQSYNDGAVRMISTKSTNAAKDGWDLYVSRLKDNNRQKGNVIYLAGHTFATLAGGNRIVLNTLLNLAYKPESLETSRSEPVADISYNADGTRKSVGVLTGTYLDTPPQALFPERINYRMEKAEDWIFPYIEGRFRSFKDYKDIETTRQGFAQHAQWEASERMPAPGARTLFTVLGTNQAGLKRISFERAQVDPDANCRDDASTGKISKVCDLQEAMGLDRDSSGNLLDPNGTGKVDPASSLAKYVNHWSQHLLQRVRGFCVAHTLQESMTPNEGQCDNRQFGEVGATLGGLDHASAAVVGYSKYLGSSRPEVAYIGGLDGQLHAIYLRGTQTGFNPPQPGTELWAFLPKGQLSRLTTNNARVDVSPAVSDIFVDYDDVNADGVLSDTERSTGKFRWRTVLVSGSGRLGGELFALDVTDPIKPIVLWDIVSSLDKADSTVTTENTSPRWKDNWKDGSANAPPLYSDLNQPTSFTGPYNYADLGDTLTVNLVPVRRGNRLSYQVVLSTNGARSGAQQLQVFAIDAGTGKKIWQWERPYGESTSNSVPGGTSTLDVDGDGGMDRVYVGDMEGRVWELSAFTGVNLNYFSTKDTLPVSYPLFAIPPDPQKPLDAHPVSTAPALMRLPSLFEKDSVFAKMDTGNRAAGKLALVFGTAGADWVLSRNPNIQGRVYVVAALPEDKNIRDQLSFDKVNPVPFDLRTSLALRGTANPKATTFQLLQEKERAVGSPKIVGGKIVMTTAYGTTESSPFASNMQGRTHVFDLNSAAKPDEVVSETGKAAAGPLVLPDGSIITLSMTGMQRTEADKVTVPSAGLSDKRTPARIGSWLDMGRALAE